MSSSGERTITLPELGAMRELRSALARGGLRGDNERAPGDWARLAAFRAVSALLTVLDAFRQRVERGERCRVVCRELDRDLRRVVLEIVIEE